MKLLIVIGMFSFLSFAGLRSQGMEALLTFKLVGSFALAFAVISILGGRLTKQIS